MIIQVSLSILLFNWFCLYHFLTMTTDYDNDSDTHRENVALLAEIVIIMVTSHSHFFFLPLFFNASAIIHCSCPLTDRNSSAAHFSTASIVSASTRSRKVLLLVLFSFSFAMAYLSNASPKVIPKRFSLETRLS